jgi:hypothetical protein
MISPRIERLVEKSMVIDAFQEKINVFQFKYINFRGWGKPKLKEM